VPSVWTSGSLSLLEPSGPVQARNGIALPFILYLESGDTRFILFFFFQALKFLVESFGLLNDLFPFPPIQDTGYPIFDLHLANVLFNVILPSVLGSSL